MFLNDLNTLEIIQSFQQLFISFASSKAALLFHFNKTQNIISGVINNLEYSS